MISQEQAESIKEQLLQQLEKLPEEQASALKKQIQEASPEELEAFVRQSQKAEAECLFCSIMQGKLETVKIYEDADILAVLDIYPASKGHMLIFPKQHFQFMHELPDQLLNKLFIFVKIAEPILRELTNSQGISIYIVQGVDQKVPHFCINLIPRFKDDKLNFEWPRQKANKDELKKLGEEIREKAEKIVREKFEQELQKELKKQKAKEASEAEKIIRHVKPRMP